MQQLSMLDALCPSPEPEVQTERMARKVSVRAFGGPYVLTIHEGDPEPIEIEVRGVKATVKRDRNFALSMVRAIGGDRDDLVWFSTYVMDAPGSPSWSETGFRSFGLAPDNPAEIAAAVERYIAAPAKHGNGCGGKLVRW